MVGTLHYLVSEYISWVHDSFTSSPVIGIVFRLVGDSLTGIFYLQIENGGLYSDEVAYAIYNQ